MADTILFLSWDAVWGRDDPRMAVIADDPERLRRQGQAIEAAQRVWEGWFLRTQGASIDFSGAAGHAQVPAAEVGDLERVRAQVKQCLGDAEIAVGVGLKLSEADLALKLAKRRNGSIVFYTDDVPKALEKESDGLAKADPPPSPAPAKVAENSPAAGGGFSGASQPGAAAGAQAPSGEASEHSEAEGEQSLVDEAPSMSPETTHAGADFEKQFGEAADGSAEEDENNAAQTADGSRLADLKTAIVEILKGLRDQKEVLAQLQALEPDLYAAVTGCVKAMLMMAKELQGTAPVKKSEEKIEADPTLPPPAEDVLDKAAVPDAGGGLAVDHYSGHPTLKTVQPRFQGSGSTGPERQRPNRIPRSYFYVRGTKPEAHVAANAHLYHGTIKPGTRLYDFGEDPDSYLAPKWVQTNHGQLYQVPDLDDVEHDLHKRGFHGYRNYGPDGALALFHPLNVRRADIQKMDDMPAQPDVIKAECKHFYGNGKKCLRCKAEKGADIDKGELPLPESKPTHKQIKYPVGAVKDSGPEGTRDVGKVKVQHPDDGKTGWVSVRAGQVLSQDGHPISSRNPGGK